MQISQIVIQTNKSAMLSGACIPIQPKIVFEFGGINEALIYQHIGYLSKAIIHHGETIQATRLSYTRLTKMIPSMSRRWAIEMVAKLETQGALTVIKTKRVNLLALNPDYKFKTQEISDSNTQFLVFPELLKHMSPIDAILLQQIHIRCVGNDGSVWVIRSRTQIRNEILTFVSLPTVNRAASRLEKSGLLFVKPYEKDDGVVNSYRVNYIKLAELIGLPSPVDVKPYMNGASGKWTSPLYPKDSIPASAHVNA